ncbi:MAG: leucine--tRNA ligase, partial [Candidatus Bilamarchaeaceae archaeon]
SIFSRIYGIPESRFKELEDPEKLVMYFSREIEQGMREMGYSVDWRRKFYTFDVHFNKFIEWHMKKLHEKGLVIKGSHRLAWCPSDNNVVSSHDTKGDVDPEIEEVAAIKFALEGAEGGYLVASTYRPETVYGVTNVWVNPSSMLVKVKAGGGEILYFAKEAWESLSMQIKGEVIGEVPASNLIGKKVESPLGRKVPVFEAKFVEPGEGTGIVMSVPAHAPYDYLALKEIGKLGETPPITIIEYRGSALVPAQEYVETLGVKGTSDPLADTATKELYKKEAHWGRMKAGEFAGMPVMEAKEKVKEKFEREGKAFPIYVLANGPVFCRCGSRIVVKKVDDQWFIDYGNPEWKKKAKECLGRMETIPEATRKEYLAAIEWLKEKACTRSSGLGTKFPYDKEKIVEPLSDSTIYMAFYTIAHELRKIEPSELTEEFFDYVFLGRGSRDVHPKAKMLREKFLYWYPLDARHSGADLVRNHLPFFVMNHAAIFPPEHWPKSIIVNGFVLMEGKKMSKSLGNILPLRKAVEEYGADVVRFSVVAGADLSQDTNFEKSVAVGVRDRAGDFLALLKYADADGNGRAERWLRSRLNRKIRDAPQLYASMALRELGQMLFYEMLQELEWYVKRADRPALKGFFEKWAVAFSPFMPHLCEEVWHSLGKEGFVVEQRFPKADEGAIDDEIEAGEGIIAGLIYDMEKISERFGKKAKKAYIYVASDWKRGIQEELRESKDMNSALEWARKNRVDMGKAASFAKGLMKRVHSLQPALSAEAEFSAISDASGFISREIGAEAIVKMEGEAGEGHEKASLSAPGKPAVILE